MSFHSATISTIFKELNSLLMLKSSPFNVNITNKITKFNGFMKLACSLGHSKEKKDFHASLHHQECCQLQKYLLKLSRDYQLSKCSIFKVQAFRRHCSILKVQIPSNFTRNKSLELVLAHNANAILLLDFLILMCSFIYRESSELVDRRYDSRNTLKRFCYKCFKCLFLAMTF